MRARARAAMAASTLPLLLLLLPAPAAQAQGLDVTGSWSIQMQTVVTAKGEAVVIGCNFQGTANVVQTGSQFTGDATVNLTSGGMTCPPTMSANLSGNVTGNPNFVSSYCDGSRQPPEFKASGWQVPAGISDATVPNPIFNLTPVATVDEGNNWINLRFGPLSLTNPTVTGAGGNYGGGAPLGNYALASSSGAIDHIPVPDTDAVGFPTTDFFGNPRPDPSNPNAFDVGAVEFQGNGAPIQPVLTSIAPSSGTRGSSVNVTLTGTGLSAVNAVNAPGSPNITASNVVVVSDTTVTATLNLATGTSLGGHNINVSTPALTSNNVTFTVLGPTLTNIAPNFGERGTSNLAVTITGTGLATATGVTIGGGGVTCTPAAPAPTNTTVHATCNITSGAAVNTGRAVTVATGIGNATGVTFAVTGATVTEAGSFTSSPANRLPKAATITVTNTGTGPTTLSAAPTIAPVTGTGTWTVGVGGTCGNGVTLAAGGGTGSSCTVNATYLPPVSVSACTAGPSCTSTAHVVLTGTGFAAATQNATPDITGN